MDIFRKLGLVLLVSWFIIPSHAAAQAQQQPDPVERAYGVLGMMFHGPFSYSAEERDRIIADQERMAVIAELLRGERASGREWYPATALMWLAETGNPAYSDIFLRYSTEPDTTYLSNQMPMALYGLARTAEAQRSGQRLREVLRSSPRLERGYAAAFLSYVNTPAARGVLRAAQTDDLEPRIRSFVQSVLATPARQRGKGRACPRGEASALDAADGVRKCMPKP